MRGKPTEEEKEQYLQRMIALEKRVVLPARIAVIFACIVLLWPVLVTKTSGRELTLLKWSAVGYVGIGLAYVGYWIYLFRFAGKVRNHGVTKAFVFGSALTDNIFLGLLVNAAMIGEPAQYYFLGRGPEASLFWACCALVVRNTFLFSELLLQTSLSGLYIIGYTGALLLNIGAFQGRALAEGEGRLLIFRVLVLALLSVCGSALYSLGQRRRRELDEAHERTIRSQRLDMAGMLAAQVAHELKNPLSIMNNAAFLLRKSKKGLEPGLTEQVEIIEEEISRADQIITELLDYARLAEGKIEAVLVNDSIDESISALKHEFEGRRITIERKYALDLPFLFIDPGQLRQVFNNILLNAGEAISDGGRIEVSTRYADDAFIEVSIADTGKGMTPDVLARIFTPFYSTKEKGTGMGLSIVQNVMRAYSGNIVAQSEVGKGTTFQLRFPTRMAKRMMEEKSGTRTRELEMGDVVKETSR